MSDFDRVKLLGLAMVQFSFTLLNTYLLVSGLSRFPLVSAAGIVIAGTFGLYCTVRAAR